MANLSAIFDGVIAENSVNTPIAVLKELSQVLVKRTNGLLVGKVVQEAWDSQFSLEFYITAPSLNNYSYQVLEIKHDLSFYPLDIRQSNVNANANLSWKAENQEELEEILKTIISSSQVKKVINGLLAQIKSA